VVRDVFSVVDEDDSVSFEFIGECGEDGGGAAVVTQFFVPEVGSSPVGDVVDELETMVFFSVGDGSDHDGLGDVPFFEGSDPLVESGDAYLFEPVTGGREVGLVLVGESDGVDLVAVLVDSVGDEDGELTTAGDETDGSAGLLLLRIEGVLVHARCFRSGLHIVCVFGGERCFECICRLKSVENDPPACFCYPDNVSYVKLGLFFWGVEGALMMG